MTKREFLQLAHVYDPKKHSIYGWFASEKLDGMRAYWDPTTRGIPKNLIPWANHEGDERYVNQPVATGLWSRYGNVIHAPDWWLDKLPMCPMDGELYAPGFRQHLMSIVKRIDGGGDWSMVKYYVFDLPAYVTILQNGRIYSPNYRRLFVNVDIPDQSDLDIRPQPLWTIRQKIPLMQKLANDVVVAHEQIELPFGPAALRTIDDLSDKIISAGGEGLIVRNPDMYYECKRTHNMVKIKPCDDAEGVVVGYVTGRETDLGSKLRGKMGALVLRLNVGHIMELSGFTDAERELSDAQWAWDHPGQRCPAHVTSPIFPLGTRVTFKHRGYTADGIPQEARYFRHA